MTQITLLTAILLAGISFAVYGQTNVSGGIYTNTTWTLANSPYIVVDTVVVFPGATLTIEPGVTVKFANAQRIEIRQAKLIALGTSTDSITFSSNSITPTAGVWNGIFLNLGSGTDTLKFSYCNFKYANIALNHPGSNYSFLIKNCNFSFNNIGLTSTNCKYSLIDSCNFSFNTNYGIGGLVNANINYCNFLSNGIGLSQYSFGAYNVINNCRFYYNQTGIADLGTSTVKSCTFKHNQFGIISGGYAGSYATVKDCIIDSNNVVGLAINSGDTLSNNEIRYNSIGLTDSLNVYYYNNVITKNTIENNGVGIKLFYSLNQLYCNVICNSTIYDLHYNVAFSSNINARNNYWCTSDSISTLARIYDGYDNINLGLVSFMPYDTIGCGLDTVTIVNINTSHTVSFNIFPNPASNYLTVALPINFSKTEIKIFNMLEQLEYFSAASEQKTGIDVSTLTNGVYIVQIKTGENITRKKFIKQ